MAGVGEDGIIQEMLDDPDNLSSLGMLCVKGRFGYTFVHHEDRITSPLIRKNGALVESTWDEALDLVAEKLIQYRGDSFGTLCSAKATNEDGYVQQKFARLVMKSNHIDHCTRLCHSPSVEAMLESLGSGATSNSYIDYEEAGCLVIIGSDANSNHPVAASRMRRAVIEHGAKLIVINPRRIDMCDFADLWLRPRPGTDVALLNGIANVILSEGLADDKFINNRTEGFDDWKDIVERYTADYASSICGVPAEDIIEAGKVDQIIDTVTDINELLNPSMRENDPIKKREMRAELTNKYLPNYFGFLENILHANNSNWFVGGKMSVADIAVWGLLGWITSGVLDDIPTGVINPFKRLKKLYNEVSQNPHVREWKIKTYAHEKTSTDEYAFDVPDSI